MKSSTSTLSPNDSADAQSEGSSTKLVEALSIKPEESDKAAKRQAIDSNLVDSSSEDGQQLIRQTDAAVKVVGDVITGTKTATSETLAHHLLRQVRSAGIPSTSPPRRLTQDASPSSRALLKKNPRSPTSGGQVIRRASVTKPRRKKSKKRPRPDWLLKSHQQQPSPSSSRISSARWTITDNVTDFMQGHRLLLGGRIEPDEIISASRIQELKQQRLSSSQQAQPDDVTRRRSTDTLRTVETDGTDTPIEPFHLQDLPSRIGASGINTPTPTSAVPGSPGTPYPGDVVSPVEPFHLDDLASRLSSSTSGIATSPFPETRDETNRQSPLALAPSVFGDVVRRDFSIDRKTHPRPLVLHPDPPERTSSLGCTAVSSTHSASASTSSLPSSSAMFRSPAYPSPPLRCPFRGVLQAGTGGGSPSPPSTAPLPVLPTIHEVNLPSPTDDKAGRASHMAHQQQNPIIPPQQKRQEMVQRRRLPLLAAERTDGGRRRRRAPPPPLLPLLPTADKPSLSAPATMTTHPIASPASRRPRRQLQPLATNSTASRRPRRQCSPLTTVIPSPPTDPDALLLRSTTYTLTSPLFAHGPIRLLKSDVAAKERERRLRLKLETAAAAAPISPVDDDAGQLDKAATAAAEATAALDWTAFQMAILGGAGEDWWIESREWGRPRRSTSAAAGGTAEWASTSSVAGCTSSVTGDDDNSVVMEMQEVKKIAEYTDDMIDELVEWFAGFGFERIGGLVVPEPRLTTVPRQQQEASGKCQSDGESPFLLQKQQPGRSRKTIPAASSTPSSPSTITSDDVKEPAAGSDATPTPTGTVASTTDAVTGEPEPPIPVIAEHPSGFWNEIVPAIRNSTTADTGTNDQQHDKHTADTSLSVEDAFKAFAARFSALSARGVRRWTIEGHPKRYNPSGTATAVAATGARKSTDSMSVENGGSGQEEATPRVKEGDDEKGQTEDAGANSDALVLDVPVPMGYNLGHDLGDFLKWEAEHVYAAAFYGRE